MNWYTAKCLFRCVVQGKRPDDLLRECTYFLVRAKDNRDALKRAAAIAKSKQHSYVNQYGGKVEWIFERVLNVKEILAQELDEGTEIYYTYLRRTSAAAKKQTR
jgi:hypothetical protein